MLADAVGQVVEDSISRPFEAVLDPEAFAARCGQACLEDDWLDDVGHAVVGQRHRIFGAVRAAGGYATAQAGAALLAVPGAEGVGVALIGIGADQTGAGLRSMWTNAPARSALNAGTAAVCGENCADHVEAAVLGMASAATVGANALARPVSPGVSTAPTGTSTAGQSAGNQIGATGRIGEQALKALGGKSQQFFRTTRGPRYIDQLVNGIAHESKVGYTTLTRKIAVQIAKDKELMAAGRIDGSVWNFFTSPLTGRGGPSGPLRQALNEAGISIVVH